jgi:glutaredoxin
MAKQYLDENNIEYNDHDVSHDKESLMTMVKKTGQRGVPVIEIDDNIIIGFDKAKLNEQLNLT